MADSVAAKVLVVEDSPAFLQLMKQILSKDFTVFTTTSAEEALQLLRTERVHAVVADQMLPGMVGVELLKQVASLQPNAARILVTASGRVEDAQDAINQARVRRFLAKPFRTQDLLATVGEAVHEAALVEIRDRLVQELKERNGLGNRPPPSHPRQRKAGRRPTALEQVDSDLDSRMALRDGLTGVFNHRFFQEALSAELVSARRQKRKVGLVLVDVDGFRRYNLSLGYASGDKLLQQVGQILVLEATDSSAGGQESHTLEIISRYGGDVFGVLLPTADMEAGRQYAERVRLAVERFSSSKEAGHGFPVTVSAAVAVFPDSAQNEQELIAVAEEALRAAKAEGRNRVRTVQGSGT